MVPGKSPNAVYELMLRKYTQENEKLRAKVGEMEKEVADLKSGGHNQRLEPDNMYNNGKQGWQSAESTESLSPAWAEKRGRDELSVLRRRVASLEQEGLQLRGQIETKRTECARAVNKYKNQKAKRVNDKDCIDRQAKEIQRLERKVDGLELAASSDDFGKENEQLKRDIEKQSASFATEVIQYKAEIQRLNSQNKALKDSTSQDNKLLVAYRRLEQENEDLRLRVESAMSITQDQPPSMIEMDRYRAEIHRLTSENETLKTTTRNGRLEQENGDLKRRLDDIVEEYAALLMDERENERAHADLISVLSSETCRLKREHKRSSDDNPHYSSRSDSLHEYSPIRRRNMDFIDSD